MGAISVLMKPSSSMCNMQCDYCFYCDEANKRDTRSYGFMSEETLKNIIRKTLPHADTVASFAYQGGEPTLRGIDFFKKAVQYQKQYNKNNVYINNAFQTNGYLIDEEWCKFFRENNFLVGISIDGIPEIHNKFRHKSGKREDTFDRILHTTKLLDYYKVDYNVLTVVTKDLAENINEVYQYYKCQGWKYQQYIACLSPLEEAHDHVEYALTPQIYGEFLVNLFKLWREDRKRKQQPYIRQFENYIGLAAGYMAEACDQTGICGIQNVVEADGSVYPCDFYMLDEYKIGNFNEDRLDVINERRKEIGFIEKSKKLNKKCYECKYYTLCRGGCQRNRDFNKQTGLFENYYCQAYKIFFNACYDEIIEISKSYI